MTEIRLILLPWFSQVFEWLPWIIIVVSLVFVIVSFPFISNLRLVFTNVY